MPYASDAEPWIVRSKPRASARFRLFCFTYSGGNSSCFRDWADYLPAWVDVWAVEFPGRQRRIHEKPISQFPVLLDQLSRSLRSYFYDLPFAFFGHSLGGLVCFELAYTIKDTESLLPKSLFISGCNPPDRIKIDEHISKKPDEYIIKKLRNLQGTPEWVFQNSELMQLILPLVRADYSLIETYPYDPHPPLDIPIYVFGGRDDDDVKPEDLEGWGSFTTSVYRQYLVPGGHLFINSSKDLVLGKISEVLRTNSGFSKL